jgi:hypothetical protein
LPPFTHSQTGTPVPCLGTNPNSYLLIGMGDYDPAGATSIGRLP